MAVKKILTVPNPILRRQSKPVKKIDKKIKQLAIDLIETAKAAREPKGVGLSAVQIGKLVRMFVIKKGPKFIVYINPKITWRSKRMFSDVIEKKELFLEGCLSLPGYYTFIDRSYSIKLEWQDLKGKKHQEKFKDRESAYVQHELDHLDGTLFPDRALKQKSKIYKVEKNKDGQEVFTKVEI